MAKISFSALVKDGEHGELAVFKNGPILARQLGYSEPSKSQIAHLQVLANGEIVFETEIGEGKFLSAILVEALVVCRDGGKPAELIFNDAAKQALFAYMGETVYYDAQNPDLDNHGFVRALLCKQAQNANKVTIGITWK